MPLSGDAALAALNALLPHVAIMDPDGDIIWTNERWRGFGVENAASAVAPSDNVGDNYFEACSDAADPDAAAACEGLRALAAGDQSEFELEYPCHSPNQKRWFVLYATRFHAGDDPYLVTVHTDVTDRKLAQLALERRIETAEAVAAMLSHDLRNPLMVALGRIELAVEDAPSDDLDTALSALHRVEEMIGDAITFLRVEATALDRAPVSLSDAARDAWASIVTGAATLDVARDCSLSAHPGLLGHLLENLFKNAVEHAGPEVTVTVGPLADGTGFSVSDDGPGFPVENRRTLFDLGGGRSGGDSGFGLPIVRAVADAHGWTLALTDGADGGARIDVRTAPAAPDPEP